VQTIEIEPTFESWQEAARALLREGVPPVQVRWREGREAHQPSLRAEPAPSDAVRVPRQFLELARQASAASDPARWQILYDTLWRLVHENRDLLKDARDPGVRRLQALLTPKGAPTETSAAPGEGAAPFVPVNAGLGELKAAAAHCQGCDLYHHATQTVFGRGSAEARIVFIGEQPGDQEDLQGAPFVGPAGEVFERALADAGLAREKLYAELALIKPDVLVCLGATAAKAIFGDKFRITRDRGHFAPTRWASKTIATYHPSAVLRGETEAQQAELYAMLLEDLKKVARA